MCTSEKNFSLGWSKSPCNPCHFCAIKLYQCLPTRWWCLTQTIQTWIQASIWLVHIKHPHKTTSTLTCIKDVKIDIEMKALNLIYAAGYSKQVNIYKARKWWRQRKKGEKACGLLQTFQPITTSNNTTNVSTLKNTACKRYVPCQKTHKLSIDCTLEWHVLDCDACFKITYRLRPTRKMKQDHSSC